MALFFVAAAIFTLACGFIGLVRLISDLSYICRYGTGWEDKYKAHVGAGRFAEDQRIGLICGLTFVGVVLVAIWGYKQIFQNKRRSHGSRHRHRRHRGASSPKNRPA